MYKTKPVQYKWKKENAYTTKFRKENRTHDSLSSSLEALTTELLQALRPAGLKFTPVSHRGLYWGLAQNRLSTSVQDQACTI